jgi:hypothetical protein
VKGSPGGFQLHFFQNADGLAAAASAAVVRVTKGFGFRVQPGIAKIGTADNKTVAGIGGFFPLRVKIQKRDGGNESRFVYSSEWHPEVHDGVQLDTVQPFAPTAPISGVQFNNFYLWAALEACESEEEYLRAACQPPGYNLPQPLGSQSAQIKATTVDGTLQQLESGLNFREELTLWLDDNAAGTLALSFINPLGAATTQAVLRPGRSVTLKLGTNVKVFGEGTNAGDLVYCIERGS